MNDLDVCLDVISGHNIRRYYDNIGQVKFTFMFDFRLFQVSKIKNKQSKINCYKCKKLLYDYLG